MTKKVILPSVAVYLLFLCTIAIAASGDWINHQGPWMVPHITPGNPAIGYFRDNTYLFDPASREIGPTQFSTFRSTDFGENWDRVDPLCNARESVCPPNNAQFAWTCGGDEGHFVRVTDDGGDHWYDAQDGILNPDVNCIDLLQSSVSEDWRTGILYAGCFDINSYSGNTVFKTMDGGQNWGDVSSDYFDGMWITDLSVSQQSQEGNIAIASVYYAGLDNERTQRRGFYLTTDGGARWERKFYGDGFTWCATFAPYSDRIIYGGLYDARLGLTMIVKTEDRGESWDYIGEYGYIPNQIVVLNASGDPRRDTVLCATGIGLYYSLDAGIEWDIIDRTGQTGLCDDFLQGIAVAPAHHDSLAVRSYGNFYVSPDFGDTWYARDPEVWNVHMGDIAVDFSRGVSRVFAGPEISEEAIEHPHLFSLNKSTNAGQDWQLLKANPTAVNNDVMIDQLSPWDLYNCIYDWESSTNFVEKWNISAADCPSPTGLPVHFNFLCLKGGGPPGGNHFCYVGGNYGGQGNLYRWTESSADFAVVGTVGNSIWDIDVIPTLDAKFVVAATDLRVYRNEAFGENGYWEEAFDGIPTSTYEIELADANSYREPRYQVAYAGTADGVYRTINIKGQTPTWLLENYGMEMEGATDSVVGLVVHGSDNSVIYAAVERHTESDDTIPLVFVSADSARSWINITRGLLPDFRFHDLSTHPFDFREYETFSQQIGWMDTTYAASNYGLYKFYENIWPDQAVEGDDIYHNPGLPPNLTTRWGPGLEIVHGDVIVPATSTLEIVAPCTVLFVYNFDITQGGASNNKSELIVYGNLSAQGSSGEPIAFLSSDPFARQENDWYGIRAMSGSHLDLRYCTIKHAYIGVEAVDPAALMIENCLLDTISEMGVYLQETYGTAEIANSRIQNCNKYGVYSEKGSFVATFDTVTGVVYGFNAYAADDVTIEDCQITQGNAGSYYGVYTEGNEDLHPVVRISRSLIIGYDQGGIGLIDVQEGSAVTDIEIGETGTYGIYIMSDYTVPVGVESWHGNQVKGNACGLFLSSPGAAFVRNTKFSENTVGCVFISDGAWADLGTSEQDPGNNAFYALEESKYLVDNENIDPVYAIYNYWNPLDDSRIYNAYFDPWLEEDPLPKPGVPGNQPFAATDFELAEAFPNPFNPTTTIRFGLSSPQEIAIDIYNLLGQRIRNLYNGQTQGGITSLIWDGTNDASKKVAAGLYLVKLKSAESNRSIKVTVLK